ncbi:lysis protein [Xenorhabdus innexi]|uniref:Lysis protein n=1 Tax=Xenorhabdus innexi TaxID=290109 RepID=A0A1N6MQC5_9GAMM|nr:lysis protein [Xenorhabdus innexi]PHM25097.1 lysis protein [Xenorhabdus innexi]SIP70959.1 putative Phosphoprotein phosphatase [Xenorhabdus innexi]
MGKLIIALIIALSGASFAAHHYHSKYGKQLKANQEQATTIQQLTDTINYQNTHIDMLHELDSKHTQELAHAKTEIDRLHSASLAHPERVYIQAKCPVSKTVASSGMDDAATARPTDAAIRNYWLLRERIATSEQMIQGLQEYVREQCHYP